MKRVKRSRRTRRALLVSFSSMLMCVAMLVGTTFAWFTDTASTSVNRIQAGELDVELVKPEANGDDTYDPLGTDALKWVASDGRNQDEILWEPGAEYNLDSFRIKNNGNLALKYKVIVNGLSKSDKSEKSLLDVIDFTVTIGSGEAQKLTEWEGKLGANAVTEKITITGKMKDTADNAYQNMSLTGIGITVVATQDTVEYDSSGNDYDAKAVYPVIDSAGLSAAVVENDAIVAMADGKFTLSTDKDGKNSVSITADNLTISGEGSGETVLQQDESKYYEFSGDNTTLKNITIDASNRSKGYYYAVNLTGDNATLDGVTIKNAKTSDRDYDAVCVEVAKGTTCRITNCDISGEGYLITSTAGKLNGTLLIEDTKLNPTTESSYSLNNISGSGKLVMNRSEIAGRNSIDVEAVFTDCTFKVSSWYSYVSNSKDTAFVNCSFGKDFYFKGTAKEQTTVTFENCYYNGMLITEDNLSSFTNLINGNNANLKVVVK